MKRVFKKRSAEDREKDRQTRETIEKELPEISERDRMARQLRTFLTAVEEVLAAHEEGQTLTEEHFDSLRTAVDAVSVDS